MFQLWIMRLELRTVWTLDGALHTVPKPTEFPIPHEAVERKLMKLKWNFHIYFSRCNKHIRSLATFNFFATIFLRFSTDVWLSTLTEKQPPVVVFTLSVICDKLNSVPHPMCCWISCESLPILSCVCFVSLLSFQNKSIPMQFRNFLGISWSPAPAECGVFNSEWWLWDSQTIKLLCAPMLPMLLLLLFLSFCYFFGSLNTQYALVFIYYTFDACIHYTRSSHSHRFRRDRVCVCVYFYRLFVCVGPRNYHTIHRVAIVFRAAVAVATNTRNTVHARAFVCVREQKKPIRMWENEVM